MLSESARKRRIALYKSDQQQQSGNSVGSFLNKTHGCPGSSVGHFPVMLTGFMPHFVWLLTTGTSGFPGGVESAGQRYAGERRTVAGDGWG